MATSEIAVRPKWPTDDELPTHFANQFGVLHDPASDEFFLSFGTVVPPALYGDETDLQTVSELQKTGTIPVRPVARIGMSPQRLLELIKTLQTNYRNYQATKSQLAASQEEQEHHE
jgi:hypothetical protein